MLLTSLLRCLRFPIAFCATGLGKVLGLGLIAILLTAPLPGQEDGFVLVVNSSNPGTSLRRADVGRLFLKKTTMWQHSVKVAPVDQRSDSAVRDTFSQRIHGKNAAKVKSYWQRLIFSGRATPPPEVRSDREVLDFVSRNAGAIGYVSSTASLGSGVKALSLQD